jgi:uncharacterized membrane protein YgdD (TMEM256/DUF423 family)
MDNNPVKEPKQLVSVGIMGALAVALGALGAHALKGRMSAGVVTADQFSGYQTAVAYHVYHTLAMGLMALFLRQGGNRYFLYAYRFFFWGTVLFSGSLYLLCTRTLFNLEWVTVLGPVTPVGGVLFVAGWICVTLAFYKKR